MMVEEGLGTAPFRVVVHDSLESTNDEALRVAKAGEASDGLVILARRQTRGRGRLARTWVSLPGNLHCSILLANDFGLGQATQIGFAAAVALVDAVRGLIPGLPEDQTVACKWPNDVLAGRRKLAGMLLEPVGEGWLVLGLGVNVAAAPPADQTHYPATALAELGWKGETDRVLAAFCAAFAPWLTRWRTEGFAPIREAWLERALGVGGPVRIGLMGETLVGTFVGLAGDGAMLIDQDSLGPRRILAGDVSFPALDGRSR